jgi:hypothetical protein
MVCGRRLALHVHVEESEVVSVQRRKRVAREG